MNTLKLLAVSALAVAILSVTGCAEPAPVAPTSNPTTTPSSDPTPVAPPTEEQKVAATRVQVYVQGLYNGCDGQSSEDWYNTTAAQTRESLPSPERAAEIKNEMVALHPSLEVIDVTGLPTNEVVDLYSESFLWCIMSEEQRNVVYVTVPPEAVQIVDENTATLDTSLITRVVADGRDPVILEASMTLVKRDGVWYISSSSIRPSENGLVEKQF